MSDFRGRGRYIIIADGTEQSQNNRLVLKKRNCFLIFSVAMEMMMATVLSICDRPVQAEKTRAYEQYD